MTLVKNRIKKAFSAEAEKAFYMFKILKHHVRFQVEGLKSKSIGKSSSLPASISMIRTILVGSEKNAKFCVGPTPSSPGPILLRAANTDVKFVIRSWLSNDTRIIDIAKINT